MGKLAFITQTYKADLKECKLLCESIDKFAPSFEHFIFVNDEDINLFTDMSYGKHRVLKKSVILPWYFFRIPWKIMGHHFYVSPISLPMREWIMQQICKLSVFDIIGTEYEAVFNIDSETVLMKPVDLSTFSKNGKFRLFRTKHTEYEVAHNDYVSAINKFFKGSIYGKEVNKWNYMDMPVCFVQENLKEMLKEINNNSPFKNWKTWLASTYRFSENYTYGNYVVHKLNMRKHYLVDTNVFPVIQVIDYATKDELHNALCDKLHNIAYSGVCLQKMSRKNLEGQYIDFDIIKDVIYSIWNKK